MCPTQSPNDGYVNWDIPEVKVPKRKAFNNLMSECPWTADYRWNRFRTWKWKILHWFGRRKHVHLQNPARGITYTGCYSKAAILRCKVEGRFKRFTTNQRIFDSYKKKE